MGKSSPKAPDPVKTAEAQGAANAEAVQKSAEVNQIAQYGPWGSVTYSGEIGTPNRAQTTTLSPEAQAQFNQQNSLANQLLGFANQKAGQINVSPMQRDFSADGQRVEKATFDQAMKLLNPQFDRRYEQINSDLAARGIPVQSEMYDNQMEDFNNARSSAEIDAAYGAIQAGQQEQNRLFNLEQAGRNQDINEIAAILQGAPATSMPQANAPAQYQVAAPDIMGSTYNSYLANSQAAQQRNTSMLNGLFGLGSAGISFFSSKDLKHMKGEEEGILDKLSRLPIERWQYKGDTVDHIGPYAEDFQAVFGVGDGKTINVIDVCGVVLGAMKEIALEVRK